MSDRIVPLQLRADGDRWRVLVACMLLNRARGEVVKERGLFGELMRRWSTPAAMADADPDALTAVLRPLGFQNRRARFLRTMSAQYDDATPVTDLFGCGRYAAEAVRVFVDGDVDFQPEDDVLAAYVRATRRENRTIRGRGMTGTVRGIGADDVREALLDLHDETYGDTFAPRDAAAFLMTRHGCTQAQAEQMTREFMDTPGVEPDPDRRGRYRTGERVRPLIAHREWRLATGRLDLAGARYLAEQKLDGAPDSVRTIQERCRAAIRALRDGDE